MSLCVRVQDAGQERSPQQADTVVKRLFEEGAQKLLEKRRSCCCCSRVPQPCACMLTYSMQMKVFSTASAVPWLGREAAARKLDGMCAPASVFTLHAAVELMLRVSGREHMEKAEQKLRQSSEYVVHVSQGTKKILDSTGLRGGETLEERTKNVSCPRHAAHALAARKSGQARISAQQGFRHAFCCSQVLADPCRV